MAATLSALTLPSTLGPDPLAVLHHLAASTRHELAFLHSATNTSHSVLAFDPLITLEFDAAGTSHVQSRLDHPIENQKSKMGGGENPKSPAPFAALEQLVHSFTFDAPHPLIGFLGFISYDIGRTLESIPSVASDELRWPLLRWTLFRHYLLHDPAANHWTCISMDGDPHEARKLLLAAPPAPAPSVPGPAAVVRSLPPAAFRETVERVKAYIAAGDIYQANLAQRWEIKTSDPSHEIYRRLCAASPAPYAAFLRFTSADGIPREVLSASPELFITLDSGEGGRLVTRPIKGTRRRDLADPAHDERLREELLASAKDQAELAMIVDLLRNDLGRVAQYGTVRVDDPRSIEQHPTVWHTVATISAMIRDDAPPPGLAALLAAVCPGGSITGAPKIRAMQIIEELEGFRRALYCGNIGAIGPQAKSLTLNIAIRTILVQRGIANVYAGGGIVADSDPQLEYEETLHKAAALFRALGL